MMQIDFSTRDGRREQGRLIQQAAEAAGLSLESLAKEIGCSRALIYQYVSGATLVQPDRLQQIALRTGRPLVYFYGGVTAETTALHERLQMLQQLLSAHMRPADLAAALAISDQVLALAHQSGDVGAEAAAFMRQTAILLQQGEFTRALALLERAIPFMQAHRLQRYLRVAEQNRGHALFALGRVEEADDCFRQLAQDEDWQTRWHALMSRAGVAEHTGEYARALALLDEAFALESTAPTPDAARNLNLYALGNLANIHLACGDLAAASATAREAQELALQLNQRDQYLEALLTLGVCRRWEGDLRASCDTLDTAARWSRLSDDRSREALALAELGRTLVAAGRLEEGRLRGKDALQIAIMTGVRRAEYAAQAALAESYLRGGEVSDARYHAAHAHELSKLMGQTYARAESLLLLGEAAWLARDGDAARERFTEAREIAEGIGARVLALQAMLGLAVTGAEIDTAALRGLAEDVASPLLAWRAWQAIGVAREAGGALPEAEQAYREAIVVLAAIRALLRDEASGDTFLEARMAWEPYAGLARLYTQRGAAAERAALLAQIDWPPLQEALEGGA